MMKIDVWYDNVDEALFNLGLPPTRTEGKKGVLTYDTGGRVPKAVTQTRPVTSCKSWSSQRSPSFTKNRTHLSGRALVRSRYRVAYRKELRTYSVCRSSPPASRLDNLRTSSTVSPHQPSPLELRAIERSPGESDEVLRVVEAPPIIRYRAHPTPLTLPSANRSSAIAILSHGPSCHVQP